MSFIYLFFLCIGAGFLVSAFVGVVMFVIDTRRFSPYKSELDNLQQMYTDKLDELLKLQKVEV